MNEGPMTLDFAIQHALEASERQDLCEECRREHKQLAGWLSELRDLRSNTGVPPVICHGGIAHPRFFGCPRCGAEVGGYRITGSGRDDWDTHKDKFCQVCGQKIDWSNINFFDIAKP